MVLARLEPIIRKGPPGIFAHNATADRTWGECQARHSSMSSPWKRDHSGPKKICRSMEDRKDYSRMLRKEFLREKAADSDVHFEKASQQKKDHRKGNCGIVQRGESVKPARLTRTRNHSYRPYGRAAGWLASPAKGKC